MVETDTLRLAAKLNTVVVPSSALPEDRTYTRGYVQALIDIAGLPIDVHTLTEIVQVFQATTHPNLLIKAVLDMALHAPEES